MFLIGGIKPKPRDGAVWPRTLAQPVDARVAGSKLQGYGRAADHLSKIENASGHDDEDACALPRKDLKPQIETLLGCISNGKPTLVADDVGSGGEDAGANSLAFAVLENDVDPKRDHRR